MTTYLLITLIGFLLFVVWCLGRAVAEQHRRAEFYERLWKRAMANEKGEDAPLVAHVSYRYGWVDLEEWPEELDA